MKSLLLIFVLSICFCVGADEANQVLIFEPVMLPSEYQQPMSKADIRSLPKPRAVDTGVFERTVKTAIQTLEDSMRKTCAREMEKKDFRNGGRQMGSSRSLNYRLNETCNTKSQNVAPSDSEIIQLLRD